MFHHFSIVKRSQPRLVHFFLLMSTFFGISYVNNSTMTVWIWMFADLLEHKVVMPTWFDHFSVQCHHEDGDRSRSSLIILWHFFIVGFEIKAEKNEFFLYLFVLPLYPFWAISMTNSFTNLFLCCFCGIIFFFEVSSYKYIFDFSLQYSKNSEEKQTKVGPRARNEDDVTFLFLSVKTDWKDEKTSNAGAKL